MEKIHILNILVCIAILFVIHNLVRLAVRLKKKRERETGHFGYPGKMWLASESNICFGYHL